MSDRNPLDAIERALLRIRWIGVACSLAWLLLDGPRFDRPWSAPVSGWLVALVPAVSLLISNVLARAMSSSDRVNAVVTAQIALDVTAAVVPLMLIRPSGASVLWAVLAFPVLEGAMRFGSHGAVLSSVALAVPLLVERIVRWTPGDGLQPLSEAGLCLGVALVLGLVAGSVSARLADEIADVADEWERSERRSRLLAVLTVASDRLASGGGNAIASIAVNATVELGFDSAALVIVPSTGAEPRVVASSGADRADGADACGLARLVDPAEATDISRTADGALVARLATRSDRAMVLVAGTDDESADDSDRSDAFRVLVLHLSAALRTVGRERDVAVALRHIEDLRRDDSTGPVESRCGEGVPTSPTSRSVCRETVGG